jgi:hypothetical protein
MLPNKITIPSLHRGVKTKDEPSPLVIPYTKTSKSASGENLVEWTGV